MFVGELANLIFLMKFVFYLGYVISCEVAVCPLGNDDRTLF